jgi:hypothetical protein
MKDEFDVLFSKKNSDIEYVADKYRAVSDKDKENIYNICKRKYNIMKSEGVEADADDFIKEAEGVERYSRPVWYRWVCASAASVVLIGAVSGGIMLARTHRVNVPTNQNPTTEVTSQKSTSEVKKDNEPLDMDQYMDGLLTSFSKIQRAQFGEYSENDEKLLYKVESDIIAPEEYIYDYSYYKVSVDGVESFSDFDNMLSSTYSEYVYKHLMGGDMSKYESGTRFGEETEEGKQLKHFIKYGDQAYARWQMDSRFTDMCDFDKYELVSSEFKEGAEEFDYKSSAFCEWCNSGEVYAYKFASPEFYATFEEKGNDFNGVFDDDYDDIMLCRREYKSKGAEPENTVKADFLLVKQNGDWKIANFVIDGTDYETEVTTEAVTENTSEVNSTEESSGLQIHELSLFKGQDEANKAAAVIGEKFRSGQYKFEKVDTDKYVNNMLAENADINTIENKSYIYHILWNSYFYFDTAEVEYTITDKLDNDLRKDIKASVDNREKFMRYDREQSDGTTYTYYQNGKESYEIDKAGKKYSQYDIDDAFISAYDKYVPDNLRVLYVEDEKGYGVYTSFLNNYFVNCALGCLYEDGTRFSNFNEWYIAYVDQYLGRTCVGVEFRENKGGRSHYTIDLKTGIVLKRIDYLESGEESCNMEVKSIKIDEPVDKKMFDLNGYTKVND